MTETIRREAIAALDLLAAWAAATRWEDLPEDLRARAALILLDDFAALVAARAEPELRALRDGLRRASGPAEATVFDGTATRLDRYSAALANGAGADWCELDGGYRPAVCHAALYCLPALLAEGEATGASLREMLVALVAGYEAVARLARCLTFPPLVLHPHGGLATVGAAVAVARLRGHDAAAMRRAISTAATLVLPGPYLHAVEGALIRNLWPGLCAQNGLRAVDWEAIGIAGTPGSVVDVFAGIMGASPDPAALSAGLGRDWAMREGYHKLHACCQYGHSTVEAVQAALAGAGLAGGELAGAGVAGGEASGGEAAGAGGLAAEAIAAIRVETHEKGEALDNAQPATTLAAKFSIQHIAAAAACFGHAGAEAFAAGTLTDPGLAALRGRVTIAPFLPRLAPPNDRPARVTLELRDGRRLRGECLSARGGPDRPFAREEILAKARELLAGAYPRAVMPLLAAAELDPAVLARPWAETVRAFA